MRARRLRAFVASSLSLFTLGAFVALVVACSSDDTTGSTPPPLSTSTPVDRDAGNDASTPKPDASTPLDAGDAGADARRWTGTLAQTAATPFGGSPYCKYKMTLKQIVVDVTMKSTGEIVNAKVTNTTFEEAVQPCPNPAMKPTSNEYTLASSTKLAGGGVHLTFAGVATNEPKTSLVLEGPLDGTSDTATAALEWHRTDLGAPLDWTVTTSVPLTRR